MPESFIDVTMSLGEAQHMAQALYDADCERGVEIIERGVEAAGFCPRCYGIGADCSECASTGRAEPSP